MKLSAICILGTLRVLSLLVSADAGDRGLTFIEGCEKGRKDGDKYHHESECSTCHCFRNNTFCTECGSIAFSPGMKYFPGNPSLPHPDCCPHVVESADIEFTCELLEKEGETESEYYLQLCSYLKK